MRCETHVGSITVNIKAPMCHIWKCLTVSNVITSKQKTKVKPSEQFECCYDHIKCTYKDLKLTHKKKLHLMRQFCLSCIDLLQYILLQCNNNPHFSY